MKIGTYPFGTEGIYNISKREKRPRINKNVLLYSTRLR